ncbi:unnamed protein product [Penicillium salamii]|uniref:C2H2-type domain-containing protein n=1 Tax=Penicillium salamii TaxID=1612424 RepID=A0A9W4JP17_9EURO|nr:unnamed protein product [Penicillium salamii]CAG8013473.1 unnamed protein product [Penicillium salamii]CAG8017268.1 unnamed protein product [Penicillium salamii]CAG8059569.1 unnamed protein product [Penicillium salamii]CAG8185379.1 unnamed protein product [Penicillium salamii]
MFPSHRRSRTMYHTVPESAGYSDALQPQNMGGLTGVSNGAASNSDLSDLQQWDLMCPRDQRSFLAPENCSSTRRGSLGADTFGSPFAWSTISNTDILSTSSHMSYEASTSSEANTSFMQAYDASVTFPATLNTSNVSGYDPQQIGKWCIDSTPTGEFYQSHSYPNMGPMVPTEPYFAFDVNANEQWLPTAPTSAPLPDPIPESLFSAPRSSQNTNPYTSTATTVSISSSPPRSFSDPDSPPPPSSASNASDLRNYGIPTGDGLWRCAHPGCSSQLLFKRGCDLRKHFNRHRKYLFCRYEKCPQSTQNGFSSKKDRARHEAKHNPGVLCEWEGCGKVFSRVDNMKDHVRRIHRKAGTGKG